MKYGGSKLSRPGGQDPRWGGLGGIILGGAVLAFPCREHLCLYLESWVKPDHHPPTDEETEAQGKEAPAQYLAPGTSILACELTGYHCSLSSGLLK